MPRRDLGATRPVVAGLACALFASALAVSCHSASPAFPWASSAKPTSSEHAEVHTLNAGYQRMRSHVLVREVDRPTRAALDYAAYHANFMIDEAEPERPPEAGAAPRVEQPFAGLVERATLTSDVAQLPLSREERTHPLAFAPLVEFLLSRKTPGAEALEELGSAVRSESWGLAATPGVSSQAIAEGYLHDAPGAGTELWVKIEFAPWFKALGKLPDQDGDGFPEAYGRARADRITPAVVDSVKREYAGPTLEPAQIKAWANQLSSYWYPSFNTDLVAAGERWPDDQTEPEIARELSGSVFAGPTIVLRGKPQGTATYNVFLVKTTGSSAGSGEQAAAEHAVVQLAKTRATPNTQLIADAIRQELATRGDGSWTTWDSKLAPLHELVRKRLAATPQKIKALAGIDGFLFFRNSLDFVVGGDLEQQPQGKNPLPIIVEFKNRLESLGVDFLFVPVPSKVEVFPDELDSKLKPFAGQVVNPFARKFLLSLAEHGVEVVDLLTPFLAARAASAAGQEPLYQPQDTHWTDRGLNLAAEILAARIKRYPWYAELARHAQPFDVGETTFTRFGDLQSRLPEALKKKYRPETLIAHPVRRADGTAYENDPDSPIVVLGDSFTGVYELTDAEHAGLPAQIARRIAYPTDLVMSYGGGPNVRNTLMRRGTAALAEKKLVIWVMAARDLYHYWEDWEPLKSP